MRHKIISFSELTEKRIPRYDFDCCENNSDEIVRMKKILKKAILNELTDRQRICLSRYYFEGKSMKEIASELKICPSTVTRHIKSAEKNLKRIARCYS